FGLRLRLDRFIRRMLLCSGLGRVFVLGEQWSNGKQAAAEYRAEQTTIQTIQGDGSSRLAAFFDNTVLKCYSG
ncbi:MAG: hypothetical protein WCB58_21390, partial [Acidobacteriaceae bacterium]